MTFLCPCIARMSLKYNQKDATFSRSIYYYKLLYMFQAAGSSIDLTIPDAVCTVLCSWWWEEEPPETCRAIYRNK